MIRFCVAGLFSLVASSSLAVEAVTGGTANAVQIQGRSVAATAPTTGQALTWNATLKRWEPTTVATGSGTVTSASVVTANGVSATVATATTTPAFTFTLSAITPTTVNGLTFASQSTGFTIAGGTVSKTLTIDTTGTSVVQGGALGTPASGTVTNLTGTASININGTVGATTPAAGTFTTLAVTVNGAASTPPFKLTGTWFTGGSATTTKPQFLIEPSGTTTTGWSTSGTGLGINAASGFAGRLASFQVAGAEQVGINNDGTFMGDASALRVTSIYTTQAGALAQTSSLRIARLGMTSNEGVLNLSSGGSIGVSSNAGGSGDANTNIDTTLSRNAAGIWQFGTTAANASGSWLATNGTFSGNLKSTAALATPSALSATQFTGFASTVSGASLMGYGTTNDVSLMTRDGAVVLGIAIPSGSSTTSNFVNVTGTLPSSTSTTTNGLLFALTSAGSSSQVQNALTVNLLAGYTGSSQTNALTFSNVAAGTGSGDPAAGSYTSNHGVQGSTTGSTAGTNVGVLAYARNGNRNIGVFGASDDVKTNANGIGVMGVAVPPGGTGHEIGVFGRITTTTVTSPTYVDAAILADNGNTTNPIFVAQDNGTAVFTIADGGAVTQTAKTTTYNNIATEGNGLGAIVKATRVTAQTAAGTVATYTTPASDGSYLVSGNINVTAAIAVSTSLNCDYTDETNTARTMIIPITGLGGTFATGGLATSTGPFESTVIHIRTKASTSITISVAAGTFTSTTFNAEGVIRQLQ
jgi:hypothetical protein